MALVVKDRVQETTTTEGTGTLTLLGAETGFQTFSSAIGNSNTTYYAISSQGSEFEVGIGTVGAGTLARTTILASSNGGSVVTLSAGTKFVFCTQPAGKSLYLDASGNTISLGILTSPKIGTSILDTNGNELALLTATASAVNELTIANAATGTSPTISATGGDTNIGINLTPKGTGGIVLVAGAVGTPALTTSGDLNTGIYFPAADTIAFTEGGTEAMRIDSSGNVLIGTTTTGSKGISLSADFNIGYAQGTGESVPNIFRQTSSAATVIGNGIRHSTTSNGFASSYSPSFAKTAIALNEGTIRFFSDGATTVAAGTDITPTERMRVDSSGNVIIGTTSSTHKFFVADPNNRTQGTAQVRIDGSGYSLYNFLDGTAAYIGQNSNSRSLRIYSGGSSGTGVNLAAGGTSWGTFSDERLKYEIENINDAITKIKNIRCVSYKLKDVDTEISSKRLGVIAQSLVGKLDEVLDYSKKSEEDENKYISVRYSEIIPVLIKSIQEQQEIIEQLKATSTSQQTKIESLEVRLTALENN